MTEIWVRANGTPIPQGSKVAGKTKDGRAFLRDANPRALKDWRENVAQAAWRTMNNGAMIIDPITGPVEMICWFYFEKPKSNRTLHPTSRQVGDLDKLLRAVSDALVDGGAIEDDSQIVLVSGSKSWVTEDTTRPGVMVYLADMNTPKLERMLD